MQTNWDGFGCADDNVFTTEVLDAVGLRVQLSVTEGVPTRIALDGTVRGVRLYTTDQSIRYALDTPPDPIGVSSDTVIAWSAFQRGDTLIPNQWQRCSMPPDNASHDLYLMSPTGGVTVLVQALTEME